MRQVAPYDDLCGERAGPSPSLIYTDIALGWAGTDSLVSYRVKNASAHPLCETVQVYVEIAYPNGRVRKRMVGWEVHQLLPDMQRYVHIPQCGVVLADDEAPETSLRIRVCSLSRQRAQAVWHGGYGFTGLERLPADASAGLIRTL